MHLSDLMAEQRQDAAAAFSAMREREQQEKMNGGTATPMPQYKCHKRVWALKVKQVYFDRDAAAVENRETDGSAIIVPEESGFAPFRVDAQYVRKHQPVSGGYFVQYRDGYCSFSPAQAFEDGYLRVDQ